MADFLQVLSGSSILLQEDARLASRSLCTGSVWMVVLASLRRGHRQMLNLVLQDY